MQANNPIFPSKRIKLPAENISLKRRDELRKRNCERNILMLLLLLKINDRITRHPQRELLNSIGIKYEPFTYVSWT